MHGSASFAQVSDVPVQYLWLWDGAYFGYRWGEGLFTYRGLQVGRFAGQRIFAPSGRYLGEIRVAKEEGRLLTRLVDTCLHHDGFKPVRQQHLSIRSARPALPMPPGFRRFPLVSELRHRLPAGGHISLPALSLADQPVEAEQAAGRLRAG